jgi:transcriptional regulator of acetoin/glycerol metabolism
VQEVSHEAMQLLLEYHWPGNVRELKNAIEFTVIHCSGSVIHAEDLPPELIEVVSPGPSFDDTPQDERERLTAALERARGNRTDAARLLGISRATLYRHLEKFGIM